MGIRGAALATVAAGFIVPVILAVPYFSRPVRKVFRTVANFRPDRILLMRLLRFGMPAGIQLALGVASFEIFVLLTGRLGHDALAASNIALSINLLAFMPLIGLGIAASILVGQYQGARESDLAARAGWAAPRCRAANGIARGACLSTRCAPTLTTASPRRRPSME